MKQSLQPIAFVIPWFGSELKGGAEQLAWQAANRLADRGHNVEVLTTCCRAFLEDWATNHLPAGVEQIGNLKVRRFKVDKRDAALFNNANTHVLSRPVNSFRPGINPFTLGTDAVFVQENINSMALERYLKRNSRNYHAFVFLPYLYGVVLHSLPLVADKAWLQPCLHNEAYAYLPQVETIMRSCHGLLYNSLGEEKLAHTLFGPGISRKGVVVGVGIEDKGLQPEELPNAVATLDLLERDYILCLGRRDRTKNTAFLVDAYARFRASHPDTQLECILAGPGDEHFGAAIPGVHDLGLVSELEKEALLANCRALFQPSRNESYSRVIMEAWSYGRPAAAHGACPATAMAVEAAEGGWTADSEEEWIELFADVSQLSEDQLVSLGSKGKKYASEYADWDAVIGRYEQCLQLTHQEETAASHHASTSLKTVHQLTPGFAYGDAISNQAILLRDMLRSQGLKSDIFTEFRDPLSVKEAKLFGDGKKISKSAGLIYHHSIGAGLTDFVANHPGPKGLIYHNVTPPEMVRDEDPRLAEILEKGITDLKRLAPSFKASAADSHFNRQDLVRDGYNDPFVLPICVTPEKWNIPTEPNMMARLQDGRDNILFVGRLVANKCQHDLIEAFENYLRMYGNCRLILVGGFIEQETYYKQLKQMVVDKGLKGDVLFAGKVTDGQLHACYRNTSLYWSMSKHEGFGVPLIEAMWFDVPVLAFNSSAVPETMGEGGIVFNDKSKKDELAVLAHMMIHNKELRNQVIGGQHIRRQAFVEDTIGPQLDLLLEKMT